MQRTIEQSIQLTAIPTTQSSSRLRLYPFFASILIVLFLSGCASTSIFTPYPETITPMLDELNRKGVIDIPDARKTSGQNTILHYLEQGRLAQINQQPELSKKYFELAIAYLENLDLEAQVRARDLSQQGSSILVNDNVIRYDLPAFEHSYIHQLQTLNYLFENDLEGAGVEVRRANLVNRRALLDHDRQLEKARTKAAELPIGVGSTNAEISRLSAAADKAANQLKSSFQNGYTFYTSAVVYELRNELEDAFLDYSRALEINPENKIIQKDIQRLAKRTGRHGIYEKITSEIGEYQPRDKNLGEVIIFYENGFVPAKSEATIPLTNYHNKAISIAFPYFNRGHDWSYGLKCLVNFEEVASSVPLSNTYSLAAKSLQERRLPMIVRQVARAVAKAKFVENSENARGDLGAVLASIYNIFTERADLRGWLSLPNSVQLIRTSIKTGQKNLTLKPEASALSANISLNIEPNSLTIIQVTNTGDRLFTRSVSFDRS